MKYYYFHGYGSSPKAEKAEAMRQVLGKENVEAPDFNVSSDKIFALFDNICSDIEKRRHEVCIVGSSLGGLYALYIASKVKCSAILLNPALLPMVIVPKVTENVPVKDIITAQQLSMYSYEFYLKDNVTVWVTNDPLINHRDLTKPFFYKGVKDYIEYGENDASGHEFAGFKNVFEKYIKNMS